ncbi:hypothetical protein [Demequina aurantiaca]|uniref:hypothetical protein n=1 Tax=Demequina aurantiaca TaxID=676200 RepID=UPI003D339576
MTDDLRGDSPLDHQLDASEPPTSPSTVQSAAALQALARETAPPPTTRHRRSVVIGSIAGVLALGIGGAAAASAFDWHSPWADDAAAEITYTLPSGAVCTGIIGNFKGDADAVRAAEAFMAQPNLVETLDIQSALSEYESDTFTQHLENGTVVDGGPGTPYWSDDSAYEIAVGTAAADAMLADLETQNIDRDGINWEGEYNCPGRALSEYDANRLASNDE